MTDILLVGGGLANSLIAWRLAAARPELRIRLLEQGPSLGGDHTWSFHSADLTPEQREWLAPLVVKTWPRYEVRFPARRRTLEGGYHSITSRRLHDAVAELLGPRLTVGVRAREVGPHSVRAEDGSRFEATCVIDGRGLTEPLPFALGYQKFIGQVVELSADHGLEIPILMDATVTQEEGYRFVYVLPWSARSLLLEETRVGDTPDLDRRAIRKAIKDYATSHGWTIFEVQHEEEGVLPIPLSGDIEAFWRSRPKGVPCSGMRAGLFHPATGYSLPQAVRLAEAIAGLSSLESETLDRSVRARSRALWREGGFYRLLNRALFRGADKKQRYRVAERFYGLPSGVIHRFSAGRLTGLDKLRLVAARPGIPILKAAAG